MTTALSLIALVLAAGVVGLGILRRFDQTAIVRLKREAYSDELTGLLNRRSFMYGLGALASTCQSWSVAIIDVDDFKAINDNLGHIAGDAALAGVADALRRNNCVAARLGGDEFAVALRQDAISSAAALQKAVRRINVIDPVSAVVFRVSVSVGVAAYEPKVPMAMLLHRADCALYEAKRSGRQIAIWGIDSPANEHSSRPMRHGRVVQPQAVTLTQECVMYAEERRWLGSAAGRERGDRHGHIPGAGAAPRTC